MDDRVERHVAMIRTRMSYFLLLQIKCAEHDLSCKCEIFLSFMILRSPLLHMPKDKKETKLQ